MNNSKILLATLIFFAGGFIGYSFGNINRTENTPIEVENTQVTSSYAGEESRGIKSLSQDDVEGLLAGTGTPFGGMAKLAELNGYPGPRHILDMADEIALTAEQRGTIEVLYMEMKGQAIPLGEQIIEIEQEMNAEFQNKTITPEQLEIKINKSAELYSQLRFVHLKYHFETKKVLSSEQVAKYNELRGYNGAVNPCDNIPEGHDPDMWKLHNDCN